MAFWLATRGELTSRSSLLYGPFSIVRGMGAVLLTLVFHRMDDRSAAVFLACSTIVSAAALCRMDQRRDGVPAMGAVSRLLDELYPDSRLRERYPNMGILSEIGWYDAN